MDITSQPPGPFVIPFEFPILEQFDCRESTHAILLLQRSVAGHVDSPNKNTFALESRPNLLPGRCERLQHQIPSRHPTIAQSTAHYPLLAFREYKLYLAMAAPGRIEFDNRDGLLGNLGGEVLYRAYSLRGIEAHTAAVPLL